MKKTAIIIPSRLDAQRLPNKPLELINNKEMILHVYEAALKSNADEVFVATPDQKIKDIVKKFGGNCVLTTGKHETGTDRVFEVFKTILNGNPQIVINLQGDMPNIHPDTINNLINYMKKGECEIGTLASKFTSNSELEDENIVKVLVKEKLEPSIFVKALDFVRINNMKEFQAYHHIGIYAFTNKALLRYVGLKRSKLELERKLEQLRALEDGMSIHVGYVESSPLSVDTKKDLEEIKRIMKTNE
tara:strand:- start:913 stop:1650 length:738 start_codon:yes stop_codon:yes gene_type:complete